MGERSKLVQEEIKEMVDYFRWVQTDDSQLANMSAFDVLDEVQERLGNLLNTVEQHDLFLKDDL
jgi:hypothetical protein